MNHASMPIKGKSTRLNDLSRLSFNRQRYQSNNSDDAKEEDVESSSSFFDPNIQARLTALLELTGTNTAAIPEDFWQDEQVVRGLMSSVTNNIHGLNEILQALTLNDHDRFHRACMANDLPTVEKLLQTSQTKGQFPSINDDGDSILVFACANGYTDLVRLLLTMLPQMNIDDRGTKQDCTALMEACNAGYYDIVELLLKHQAQVNLQSTSGNTALHYAASGGHADIVRLLLDHGAKVEETNENGHTALMEAASAGYVDVVRVLLNHRAGIYTHVKQIDTNNDDQTNPIDEMHTALMEACMDGHIQVVKLLLDHGARVNMSADSYESPLTLSACGGHLEVATLLLERGANVEEINEEGYTALMEACREGHLDLVNLLIAHAANVNQITEETQETALTLACASGFLDVVKVLLNHGAQINLGQSSPLMEASQEGHLELVQYLLTMKADVHQRTSTGDSALVFACEGGHTDIVEILVNAGSPIDQADKEGRTPLMKAARAGHIETVRYLLSKGADVNRSSDNNDATVLSLVCANGYLEIASLLLKHGANPNHLLKDRSNCLIEAAKHGHLTIVQLLLEYPKGVLPRSIQTPTFVSEYSQPTNSGKKKRTTSSSSTSRSSSASSMTKDSIEEANIQQSTFTLPSTKIDFFSRTIDEHLTSSPLRYRRRTKTFSSLYRHPKLKKCIHRSTFKLDRRTDSSPTDMPMKINTDPQKALEHLRELANRSSSSLENLSNSIQPSNLMQQIKKITNQSKLRFANRIDIDCQTESNHDTALTLSCACGHEDLVMLLLQRGANIEHRDKKGYTPLILAATAGHSTIVTRLLSHGANIEAQSERTKDTALTLACSGGKQPVVEILLKRGANCEHRNVSDYTPLSLAASGGHVNIIRMLLNAGAEINSRTGTKLGITPLMLAAMNGHAAAVKLLLDAGSDINAQIETNRNTALTLACFQGRSEVVALLVERKANIEHRAKSGLTPLMESASGGYVEVARVLLEHGADVNAAPVPTSKDTALTIAADKGHQKFVELLLRHGATIDARNKKGATPLWLACHQDHLEVVQLLITHSADPEAQDSRKMSCLMAAFREGNLKVVKYLVHHVRQFPSDADCRRWIRTITDQERSKMCQSCLDHILKAKEQQAAEANQAANNLLKEIDLERTREETKKVAAAKKREKRKAKKKEKQKDTVTEELDDIEEEKKESEPVVKETTSHQAPLSQPTVTVPILVSSKTKQSESLPPIDDEWKEVVSKPKKILQSHVEPKRLTGDKPNPSSPVKIRSKTVTSTWEMESKQAKPKRQETSSKPCISVTSPPIKDIVNSEYNPFASNILTTSLVGALTKTTDESKKNFAHVAKMNVPSTRPPSSTGPSTSSSSTSSSPSSFQQIIEPPKLLAPIGSHRPSSNTACLSRSPSNLNPSAPEFHHLHSSSSSLPQEPLSANIMNMARMMEQSPLPPTLPSAPAPAPVYYPSSPFENTPSTLDIAQFLASRGQLPADPNKAAEVVAAYYYNHVLCRPATAPLIPAEPIVHYPENSFTLVDHSNSNFSTGPSPPAAIGSERKRHIHMTNTPDPRQPSFFTTRDYLR